MKQDLLNTALNNQTFSLEMLNLRYVVEVQNCRVITLLR